MNIFSVKINNLLSHCYNESRLMDAEVAINTSISLLLLCLALSGSFRSFCYFNKISLDIITVILYKIFVPDVTYFTKPSHEWQKRYEALRASFVERLPLSQTVLAILPLISTF